MELFGLVFGQVLLLLSLEGLDHESEGVADLRVAVVHEEVVENDEIVRLGPVVAQIVVLLEKVQEFDGGSVDGQVEGSFLELSFSHPIQK